MAPNPAGCLPAIDRADSERGPPMTRQPRPSHAHKPDEPTDRSSQTGDGSALRVGPHRHRWRPVGRRSILRTGGVAVATALAGCLGGGGGGGEVPSPTAIESGAQCDVCGMVIPNHPGPNGQLFYRDHRPQTHDNPAWFDSLKACFFPYYFEKDRLDWTLAVGYVTDYSAVDYDLQDSGGETYISSHTEPASFADATAVSYVVGSDVVGAMGPDFIPFSAAADADSFAAEHGGQVLPFEDIDPELLGR